MTKTHYLYEHRCPETKDVVYVGVGKGSRAWASGESTGSARSEAHAIWLSNLFEQGYTMADVVFIQETLLSKEEALALELPRIKELKPKFNLLGNSFAARTFTKEQAIAANKAFREGTPYYKIPALFGMSPSNRSVVGKRMVQAGEQE